MGFVLLAACLAGGRLIGGVAQPSLLARSALLFVALWFVGAAINMWVGVSKAEYSVREEAPIFLVVFLIPAAVAVFIWWRYSHG